MSPHISKLLPIGTVSSGEGVGVGVADSAVTTASPVDAASSCSPWSKEMGVPDSGSPDPRASTGAAGSSQLSVSRPPLSSSLATTAVCEALGAMLFPLPLPLRAPRAQPRLATRSRTSSAPSPAHTSFSLRRGNSPSLRTSVGDKIARCPPITARRQTAARSRSAGGGPFR